MIPAFPRPHPGRSRPEISWFPAVDVIAVTSGTTTLSRPSSSLPPRARRVPCFTRNNSNATAFVTFEKRRFERRGSSRRVKSSIAPRRADPSASGRCRRAAIDTHRSFRSTNAARCNARSYRGPSRSTIAVTDPFPLVPAYDPTGTHARVAEPRDDRRNIFEPELMRTVSS